MRGRSRIGDQINWKMPLAVAAASTVILAGCEADDAGVEIRPASDTVKRAIAENALVGVWVVPYEVPIEGGREAERSFAQIYGSEIDCQTVGEERQVLISALYATDEQDQLQQFLPPDITASGIEASTVQCVRFDVEDGDVINNDGIPQVGVFDTAKKSFVIKPTGSE